MNEAQLPLPEPPHTFRDDVRGFFAFARRDHAMRLRLSVAAGLALGAGLFMVLRQIPQVADLVGGSGRESKLTLQFPPEDDHRPRRNVDGVRVDSGSENPRLLSVMVENMVDARPISGLAGASLVFEAPVEAGITRMLAVYPASSDVVEIGPVRSARPYYLDWAAELDALFAHVGGSPEALARIPLMDLDDLNEFSRGRYFWRSSKRSAPHNVYTSTEVLRQAVLDLELNSQPDAGRWVFKNDAKSADRPSSQEITVPFSSESYKVSWQYDRDSNSYDRYQAGALHRDKDGSPIVAKNLVVVYTDIEVIDEEGRRRIRTTGSGQAVVFLDGKAHEVEWRKKDNEDRLRFYLSDGDLPDGSQVEVEWNAGPTWIEIVPKSTRVVYNE
ncbi:hypothetical protein A3F28_01695 [Candidatus Uhrbacteria bacterium RIFCSPHIGHO2_12_FULL_57_11]|uniref:DUF3048 domain-containing protein n=1 Tax=Candidatus Uhrbacteria bacterium RIFCSPHIGHO2_12_FULL_57_11 TaxID=1802398 RepID=A0A1F7UK09_9BACT|nr:MAG: hypothetical protein A3F28_01695 [Candidatus Uhrbacteria bacterium RIFCSPHIGHO2_12_FULL_57_11]